MKVKNLFLGSLACLAFAACSNDDDGAGSALSGDKYVALNIVTANETGTRAVTAEDFQDGTSEENTANKALVVFYNGNSFHSSQTVDLTWANSDNTNSNNVAYEAKTEAVIVMENPTSLPDKMIVVLNAPAELSSSAANYNLSQFKELAGDYSTATSGSFIMSNSVWDNNCEVGIETDDFKTSATEAKNNPVAVYVERVVARVDVKKDDSFSAIDPIAGDGANTIKVNVYNDEVDGNFEVQDVTVATTLLGCHLASTNKYSYLLKNLPSSDDKWQGGESWNDADNKRSYWATSYAGNDPEQAKLYNKFYTSKVGIGTFYCQENTDGVSPTKLVITAQHTFGGETKSLIQYRGTMYFFEDDFLRYVGSKVDDLNLEIDLGTGKTWYDYLKMDRAASVTTQSKWLVDVFLNNDALSTAGITLTDDQQTAINDVLEIYKEAWEWQDGKAYYYVDIEHLNREKAIVRNHLYTLNIQSITGLGTPVYDPDDDGDDDPDDDEEEIIPEKPSDESFQVAAQIYVLKWRIVSQQNVNI